MADIIRMPEVLAGAEEAAIQTWLVEPGAVVAIHQALAEIETDKAIVELTAETDGIIGRLLVPEGDSVAVGDPIIVMLASGETDEHIERALSEIGVASQSAPTAVPAQAAAPAPTAEPAPAAELAPATASAPATESAAAPAADGDGDGRRLFASPLVRRLAAQSGVAIGDIQGTGPQGRIVRRDLEKHLAQAKSAAQPADAHPALVATLASSAPTPQSAVADASYQDVPLDRMRKAIARRLTESKSSVPHFYLVADCRVDALLELRRSVNETAPRKISVNDFVLKAVAGALVEVPAANAIWNGDSIRTFSSVDLSVAVATEGGLTTPVLRYVERMPLARVSATVAELAERARAGRLKQHELEGGSFSVSNLGMYGTSEFSAILNPPQSGILAVGAARPMPVVDETGQLAVGQVMTVTLSADHRVLDGAVAAQWLAAFQRRIENPLTILI
ncbi:dihydrolipoamide acetyltransferase family protein [Microbacterium sp. QXD-8]|uniref:Dihydrolipoamide acetyltransferase component of pyruvate dehydrogenase complex n=2 Tax=Microbacterium TaxID=33882 RepID=A0ABU0YZT6_9MICO|nr:dihydrolipoamide acetyltransferase family protein [Microbacterium sp. QXD-8]MDQ7877094.1 dihydrolipoamide acetyltransferase family protein [Microbacterium sp. QXD-8]